MSNGIASKCKRNISDDELIAYLDRALPEFAEMALDEHLAECPDCRLTARRLRAASDLWTHTLAGIHGFVQQRVLVAQALVAEEQASRPELSERFRAWRNRLTTSYRAAIGSLARSTLPEKEEVSQMLEQWGWLWPLELSLPTLGHRARGRSVRKPVPAVQMNVIWVQEKNIEVEITGLPTGTQHPMVMLVPVRRGPEFRRRTELEQDPQNSDRWVARFENVEAGSYTVALEPLRLG